MNAKIGRRSAVVLPRKMILGFVLHLSKASLWIKRTCLIQNRHAVARVVQDPKLAKSSRFVLKCLK